MPGHSQSCRLRIAAQLAVDSHSLKKSVGVAKVSPKLCFIREAWLQMKQFRSISIYCVGFLWSHDFLGMLGISKVFMVSWTNMKWVSEPYRIVLLFFNPQKKLLPHEKQKNGTFLGNGNPDRGLWKMPNCCQPSPLQRCQSSTPRTCRNWSEIWCLSAPVGNSWAIPLFSASLRSRCAYCVIISSNESSSITPSKSPEIIFNMAPLGKRPTAGSRCDMWGVDLGPADICLPVWWENIHKIIWCYCKYTVDTVDHGFRHWFPFDPRNG